MLAQILVRALFYLRYLESLAVFFCVILRVLLFFFLNRSVRNHLVPTIERNYGPKARICWSLKVEKNVRFQTQTKLFSRRKRQNQ